VSCTPGAKSAIYDCFVINDINRNMIARELLPLSSIAVWCIKLIICIMDLFYSTTGFSVEHDTSKVCS